MAARLASQLHAEAGQSGRVRRVLRSSESRRNTACACPTPTSTPARSPWRTAISTLACPEPGTMAVTVLRLRPAAAERPESLRPDSVGSHLPVALCGSAVGRLRLGLHRRQPAHAPARRRLHAAQDPPSRVRLRHGLHLLLPRADGQGLEAVCQTGASMWTCSWPPPSATATWAGW